MEEVEKCRLLADGPDDIVVLLERPATDHDYSAPLAERKEKNNCEGQRSISAREEG